MMYSYFFSMQRCRQYVGMSRYVCPRYMKVMLLVLCPCTSARSGVARHLLGSPKFVDVCLVYPVYICLSSPTQSIRLLSKLLSSCIWELVCDKTLSSMIGSHFMSVFGTSSLLRHILAMRCASYYNPILQFLFLSSVSPSFNLLCKSVISPAPINASRVVTS